MANDFKHTDVGGAITQSEYHSITGHQFNNQATGDLLYASSATQLLRLGIGSTNAILQTVGGIPAWVTNPTIASPTFTGAANFGSGVLRAVAPDLSGVVTAATALTLPAVTLGGAITIGAGNAFIMGVDNSIFSIRAGTNAAGKGAIVYFTGYGHAWAGMWRLDTPNAAGTGDVQRLTVSGNSDTAAVLTLSNITVTNIKLTGAANAFGAYVLATGTGKTVDNVITALQALGLVTQT